MSQSLRSPSVETLNFMLSPGSGYQELITSDVPAALKQNQQQLIHPLFRQRRKSGIAGDVKYLDHRIAQNGGTTSSYEELPHRLQASKTLLTPQERVIQLTYENSGQRKELVYRKETQAAEFKFCARVTELRTELKTILAGFDSAIEERLRARAQAESEFYKDWGIQSDDGIVEDVVF
jgi:hypothetical protein